MKDGHYQLKSNFFMPFYLLEHVDLFKTKLPGFNLRGKHQISSVYGGMLTIMILTVMLLYSGIKLEMLLYRQNPNISSFTEEFKLTSKDVLNFKDRQLRFAWTFEGYVDKELKNDPRYVKLLMRLAGRAEGKSHETILDYHLCQEQDFKDFAPPTLEA